MTMTTKEALEALYEGCTERPGGGIRVKEEQALAVLAGLTRLAEDRDSWKKRAMTTLPELLELRAYKVAAEKAKKRKP